MCKPTPTYFAPQSSIAKKNNSPQSRRLRTSQGWTEHFVENEKSYPKFNWQEPYQLTTEERTRITSSIQQFELGENSEGKHFMTCTRNFATAAEDTALPNAVQAFIHEEQRHSSLLRRFMEVHNIPLLEKHWVDGNFRFLRKLAGLQTCVMVLVTAEIIARPYYRGLAAATDSQLLKAICRQILRDEGHHLNFQAETLRKLRGNNSSARLWAQEQLHFALMIGTSLVVWPGHGKIIKAAGYSFPRFLRSNLRTVAAISRAARPSAKTRNLTSQIIPTASTEPQ